MIHVLLIALLLLLGAFLVLYYIGHWLIHMLDVSQLSANNVFVELWKVV